MKFAIATIAITLMGSVTAFTPYAPTRSVSSQGQRTSLCAEPKEEEEGGLDLNLEEMFDMFDAADKGQDFDKAVKDIKKEKKD